MTIFELIRHLRKLPHDGVFKGLAYDDGILTDKNPTLMIWSSERVMTDIEQQKQQWAAIEEPGNIKDIVHSHLTQIYVIEEK